MSVPSADYKYTSFILLLSWQPALNPVCMFWDFSMKGTSVNLSSLHFKHLRFVPASLICGEKPETSSRCCFILWVSDLFLVQVLCTR